MKVVRHQKYLFFYKLGQIKYDFFRETPKRVYSYLIHTKENNWRYNGKTA
jgi:beta-lactamase class D